MKITYWYIIIVTVLLVGIVIFKSSSSETMAISNTAATNYDSFAECLGNAGAKFYGAFWCPHCQDQKTLFNKSEKLPYIECSTPDGEGQTQECKDVGITGYPTWKFEDGTELSGVQQFSALAEKTSCPLP